MLRKLIADSGSSKAAWKLTGSAGSAETILTSGMNPFFRSEEEIFRELETTLLPATGPAVDQIFFYGAGIVDAEKGEVLQRALLRAYPHAAVETHSDVLGAARALFGNQTGIACILGTGSNACLYNGREITDTVSPLGFILGDEGSGAVMGRKLLGDFFKQVMPLPLREKFAHRFAITREEALNRVYRGEKPNHFLAAFTPFLSENSHTAYCQELVNKSFSEFFERNVTKLPGYQNFPIGFVGSVAFFFSQILNETAAAFGFDQTTILKEPIEGLANYHTEN